MRFAGVPKPMADRRIDDSRSAAALPAASGALSAAGAFAVAAVAATAASAFAARA